MDSKGMVIFCGVLYSSIFIVLRLNGILSLKSHITINETIMDIFTVVSCFIIPIILYRLRKIYNKK